MTPVLITDRLTLRPWRLDDVPAAMEIYGSTDVARWLSPAMDAVHDEHGMRLVLQQWIAEAGRAAPPSGRWAIELTESGRLIGAIVLLPMPPQGDDLEIAWQLAPDTWGHGYASEAGHAIAHWAFEEHHVEELFAVVRPANDRGAGTAKRIGMEWVGETEKYHDLLLEVYRLRLADLDRPLPGSNYGAEQHASKGASPAG